jgi:hypothetical protein
MAKSKSKKREGEISMIVFVSKEFNLKLKKNLLSLEEIGVHKSRAERIVELAQIALCNEKTN